jgi:hypothetical protein
MFRPFSTAKNHPHPVPQKFNTFNIFNTFSGCAEHDMLGADAEVDTTR